MLRLDNSSKQQPSFWESVLPPELFQMNEELTQVDKLLDDEHFLPHFGRNFTRVSADRQLRYPLVSA